MCHAQSSKFNLVLELLHRMRVQVMLPGLDYGALRNALMPRVRDACCRTTAASVRVGALSLMAAAAGRLDRADADASLEVAAQVGVGNKVYEVVWPLFSLDTDYEYRGVGVGLRHYLSWLCC